MQISVPVKVRNSYSLLPYYKNQSFWILFRGLFPVIAAVLFFNCTSSAQVKPLNDLRSATKRVNIAIGSPIDNDATRRVLAEIDKIPGLMTVIQGYNIRYGNDTVHAMRFVDRLPDEKAPDPLLRDYYNVVVVADSAKHTSLWYTFLVKKDMQEIKYYDMKKSKTTDVHDWKKIWPATEFLRPGD